MNKHIAKYIPTGTDNRNLLKNILGTVLVKGGGMILAIILMPLYMKYFPDKVVLGVWFTILNVLNWILTFDLGIGNGLRNHLTISISENDSEKSKHLISSSYILLGIVVACISICIVILSQFIDWNDFFNVTTEHLSSDTLRLCVNISLIGILVSFFLRLVLSILYALQKAALVNAISLCIGVLTAIYLFVYPATGNVAKDFINLSVFHALVINIPLLVATIFVFHTPQLKAAKPSYKYYDSHLASKVLSLGILFLVLQLLYMVISVTNEWFISKFYAPQYCVDYQIYQKIFSLAGSIYMLALTPIWSAITKAYAEKRYNWILQVQKILYCSMVGMILLQVIIVLLLPQIIHIWLGDNAIPIDSKIAIIFVIYGCIFSWIAVLSTIVAGLGKLKTQLYGYTIAVLIKVFGIVLFAKYMDSWVFVVVITCIGLLPYCIAQPITINKILKQECIDTTNINQ